MKRKRCQCCEELNADVIDGLCGECDGQHMTRCYICKENVYRDQFCRHIFWTENGDVGSGTYETDWENAKPWVLAFCDLVPFWIVKGMREGIANGRFYLFYMCSMLGGHAHIEAHGVGYHMLWLHDHFDQRIVSEEQRDGLQWLFTLYEKDTEKANATTVGWLDEWLSRREQHETIMAFRFAGKVW